MFKQSIRENALSEMLEISYNNPPIIAPRAYLYAHDVIIEGLNSNRGIPKGLCMALCIVAKHYIKANNLENKDFKYGYNLFKSEIIEILHLCRSYEEDALYIIILTLANGKFAGGGSEWYGADNACQNCIEVATYHLDWYAQKAKECLKL